jgi:hypothetical protein
VLSSIVTIRLGGSRAALDDRSKLTLTTVVEFSIAQSISEKAVGILVPVGTCQTCSQMLQIIEIAGLLVLQSGGAVGIEIASQSNKS